MKKSSKSTAKRVVVDYTTVTHYVAHYQCPQCKSDFYGASHLNENVLEFRCTCGQRLKPRHVFKEDEK